MSSPHDTTDDPNTPASDTLTYTFSPYKVEDAYLERVFSKELSHDQITALCSLDFSPKSYNEEELVVFMLKMCEKLDLLSAFDLRDTDLKRLLLQAMRSYHPHPFHNFHHAFTVTHMVFLFCHMYGLKEVLSQRDVLVLVFSAIFHDVDHTGLTNSYHVKKHTMLHKLYPTPSPLECHHTSCATEMLSTSSLFDNVKDKEAIIDQVSTLILATDMAKHFSLLENFTDRVGADDFDPLGDTDKILTLSMLLKAADISNEARPWEVSRPWADALQDEFFAQVTHTHTHTHTHTNNDNTTII